METKVEAKLLETISHFNGMILKNVAFKEKRINGKDLLTLELIFSDQGVWNTMVLVLNKDLTVGDYQDLYEEVIK